MLSDNGVDFTETDCRENWQKDWKPQMQFGQTPCLRDGDLQLVQSNAILRHLGRKFDQYGEGLEQQAKIDMINDGVEDLRMKYVMMIYKNYEEGKEPYIAELKTHLLPFEKLLSENDAAKSGFCVGRKNSFLDYNLFDILDNQLVLSPSCLDEFPTLSGFYKLMLAKPNIAKYRETEGFKTRAINGNGKQ